MAGSILIPLKTVFDDKGLKQAQSSFGKLGGSLKGILGAAGIAVGLSSIVSGLQDAAKAAIEDTKSQALLANQLRNTVGASNEQIVGVERSIAAMQKQAAVADDEIRPAFASLVRATGDVATATKLTSLALDVAAGTGKDLGAVSLALGKAVNGSTTSLVKLVPSIKGASDPMGVLADQFKGAAEAAANNDPIKQISIIFGELQEQVGTYLLPALQDLADFMASDQFADGMENIWDGFDKIDRAFTNVTNSIPGLKSGFDGLGKIFQNGDWVKLIPILGAYIDILAGEKPSVATGGSVIDSYKFNTNQFGKKLTPDDIMPKKPTTKKAVTDYVAEFGANLADELRKQMAKVRLGNKGLSEGLIESIIGSGKGWYTVYQSILAQSDTALGRLQKNFNATAAGIAEVGKAAQEAADAAAKAAEDLKAANEALLADLNDQLASAQARLDELTSTLTPAAKTVIEVYNDAKQAYDSLVESSANFAKTIPDLVNGIKTMTKLSEPIGQFESQVVSSFGNVEASLKNALDSKLITDASYRDLSAWAKREMALMQDIARQRDELAQKISLAEAVYNDSKNAIMAYGNINGLIKTTTQTITQSQTQIVNGITTTLQKSVEQISKTNIVDEYKNILTKTKAFAAQLNQLKKMGLNKDLFKQIVDAGVEAGGATAAGIIEGGQDSVTELNSIFAELNTVGDAVAETTTVVMFNNGVDVMGGFINGMKAQAEALAATAATLATTFADAFGTALKSALEIAIDDAKKALAAAIAAINAEIAAAKAELLRIQGEITKISAPVVAVPIPVDNAPIQFDPGDFIPVGRGAGALGFKGGSSTVDGRSTINLTVNAGLGTNGAQLGGQIVELIKKYEKSSGAVFA